MGSVLNSLILSLLVVAAAVSMTGCSTAGPRTVPLERMTLEQLAALQPLRNPVLTIQDVIALSRAGTAPEEIIERLRKSHAAYLFRAPQIAELGKQGVDQAIVDYIADAQDRARQATLLTERADREADQARRLDQERGRRGARPLYYGYPSIGTAWSSGYYSPFSFGYWRWR